MVIHARCFTCGRLLADQYRPFRLLVAQMRADDEARAPSPAAARASSSAPTHVRGRTPYFVPAPAVFAADAGADPPDSAGVHVHKSPEGRAMDALHITLACCRTALLTHVEPDDVGEAAARAFRQAQAQAQAPA